MKEMLMNNKIKAILITAMAIILIITFGFSYKILKKDTIYNGVKVDSIELGGLDQQEAIEHLKKKLQNDIHGRLIIFSDGDYSNKVNYKELGIDYDYQTAAKKAYKVGREGNILKRMKNIVSVSSNGKNIDLEVKKDEAKIKKLVENISQELLTEKVEAKIRHTGRGFTVTDEVVGRSVDSNKLLENINKGIMVSELIEIPIIEDKPKATKALLSQIKDEIGSYSTKFGLNDANRVFNIKKATETINGRVIFPGEVFSFNETTGPRSKKAGYKDAIVIEGGKFVPGEGGGVCQVSSTLYNTALNSKVNIVERHSHSLPIGYVPAGKDATVAYDMLDFKFKNNYDTPIYVKGEVVGNQLIIKLYGKK